MNRWRTQLIAGLWLAMLTIPAPAAVDLDRLRSLAEQGEAEQAYRYARAHLREGRGDPRFDFYYGLAAIDAGHPGEGVVALERVLQAEPANHRARLELARGYFLLEEYPSARREFERVLATHPPPTVQANIRRYLESIRLREGRARTTAAAYLDLGAGYDSNPATAADVLSDVREHGGRGAGSEGDADLYLGLGAGGQLEHRLRPAWSVYGGLDGRLRGYLSEDDYDHGLIGAELGLAHRRHRDRYRLALQGEWFDTDTSDDRDLAGLYADWRHDLETSLQTQLFARHGRLRYPEDQILDARYYEGGLGLLHGPAGRGERLLFATLTLGRDEPREDSAEARALAERDYLRLRIGAQVRLGAETALTGALTWEDSDYDAPDPELGLTREDSYRMIEIGAHRLLSRAWSLRGGLVYTDNDSNLAPYDYHRSQLFLSLRYSL